MRVSHVFLARDLLSRPRSQLLSSRVSAASTALTNASASSATTTCGSIPSSSGSPRRDDRLPGGEVLERLERKAASRVRVLQVRDRGDVERGDISREVVVRHGAEPADILGRSVSASSADSRVVARRSDEHERPVRSARGEVSSRAKSTLSERKLPAKPITGASLGGELSGCDERSVGRGRKMREVADVPHEMRACALCARWRSDKRRARSRRRRAPATLRADRRSGDKRALAAIGSSLLGVVVDAVVDGETLGRAADARREAGVVEPEDGGLVATSHVAAHDAARSALRSGAPRAEIDVPTGASVGAFIARTPGRSLLRDRAAGGATAATIARPEEPRDVSADETPVST